MGEVLAAQQGDLGLTPVPRRIGVCPCLPLTSALRGKNRSLLGNHWPTSLEKMVASEFSKRLTQITVMC